MKGEFVGPKCRRSIEFHGVSQGYAQTTNRKVLLGERAASDGELHQRFRKRVFAVEIHTCEERASGFVRRRHQIIKSGEYYFKHGSGPAFDDVIKLSASSMEKLCFAVFESAVFLKPMADRILEKRQKRMFDIASKLSIFGNREDEKRDP